MKIHIIIIIFGILICLPVFSQQDELHFKRIMKDCSEFLNGRIDHYKQSIIEIDSLSKLIKNDSLNIDLLLKRGRQLSSIGLEQLAFEDYWKVYNTDSNNLIALCYSEEIFSYKINNDFVLNNYERIYYRDTTCLEVIESIAEFLKYNYNIYDVNYIEKNIYYLNKTLYYDSLTWMAYVYIADFYMEYFNDTIKALNLLKLGFNKLKISKQIDSVAYSVFCIDIGKCYEKIDQYEAIKYYEDGLNYIGQHGTYGPLWGSLYDLYDKTGMFEKKRKLLHNDFKMHFNNCIFFDYIFFSFRFYL